jgi:hypothetical protein
MKTEKRYIASKLLIIFCLLTLSGYTQDDLISKVKTIEKIFDQPNIEYFGVTNLFGNIDISYWDKDEVKITITIKVIAWEEDDAQRFIDKIIPEISATQGKKGYFGIFLATDVSRIKNLCDCSNKEGKVGKVYAPWFKKKARVKQYNVSYQVKLPSTVNKMDFYNRYGDISIPDFVGNMSIQLTNGNLKTGKLKLENNDVGIRVRYGKVNMEGVENSKLNLYSCNYVNIGNLRNVNLTSKFSGINVTSCSELALNSKSDNIIIENLESLRGTGDFTTLKIHKLDGTIDMQNKSGEIEIETVNPGFELISLSGQFNDYILNLDKLNYALAADLEFTDLTSSEDIITAMNRKNLRNGKATIEKQIGNQPNNSQVNLKCSNCNVVLR